MNVRSFVGSIIGNIFSVFGVVLSSEQLESIESITSIICMVLGILITIISAFIIPLVKWWKNARKDGKIDDEEIDEVVKILEDGSKELKEQGKEKEHDSNRENIE